MEHSKTHSLVLHFPNGIPSLTEVQYLSCFLCVGQFEIHYFETLSGSSVLLSKYFTSEADDLPETEKETVKVTRQRNRDIDIDRAINSDNYIDSDIYIDSDKEI